jgi:hypothetical protein
MGRPPTPPSTWGDLRYLYDVPPPDPNTGAQAKGSSYLYEISSHPLDPGALSYFYPTVAPIWSPAAPANPTWMQGKLNFLLNNPVKYRRSAFPIVRDFHHTDWTSLSSNTLVKKVYNLSWDLGVFWSIPEWENGYQP